MNVLDHFLGLMLKGLKEKISYSLKKFSFVEFFHEYIQLSWLTDVCTCELRCSEIMVNEMTDDAWKFDLFDFMNVL